MYGTMTITAINCSGGIATASTIVISSISKSFMTDPIAVLTISFNQQPDRT
jgi:hypothetical protein